MVKFKNIDGKKATVYFKSSKPESPYYSPDDVQIGFIKVVGEFNELYYSILDDNGVEFISEEPYRFKEEQIERIVEILN